MGARLSVAAVGAWLLVAVYYFYQYALRSAPSVMMPELTEAFGVNALGVSAIVGMFYYGYSPFSRVAGLAISACLLVFLPREAPAPSAGGLSGIFRSLKTVFVNPQSILCGLISGLLFIPTTIFGMTWGVRFLQEARGREYAAAVTL